MTTTEKRKAFERIRIAARRLPICYGIEMERRAQDSQWGGRTPDVKYSKSDWLAMVSKQLSEVSAVTPRESVRTAFIKTAALCCAAIEALDRA